MSDTTTRVERDTMGEMEVPKDAYYGASTQRAVINFPVSGIRLPRRFLRAIGLIKKAAAQVNRDLGLLDARLAEAIAQAAQEVADGALDAHFPLDVFQTGSGHLDQHERQRGDRQRAAEILGGARGGRPPERPRQPGAIVQRRHPHRARTSRRSWRSTSSSSRRSRSSARRLAAKSKEFWG